MNGYTDLYTSSVPDTSSMNTMNARVPTLHRQQSRQFDVYGTMPQAQNGFYDSNRGFGNTMNGLGGNQNYDLNTTQSWNHGISPFGGNNLGSLGPIGTSGATSRMRPARGRVGLPSDWMGSEPPPMPGFPPMDNGRMGGSLSQRNGSSTSQGGDGIDDDLIPTAIVIKNIPFAVRKEQLMQLMSDMNLPLPYAFNYHFDNGVFRGLAFANFTSPDETAAVIEHLNMYELQGRKLRVEYKKMLPLEQRERIEREKRHRRGQLEEQHRPIQTTPLHSFPSMSSVGSHPPPSTSPNPPQMPTLPPNVDMNDPTNFKWYQQMIAFKYNQEMETYIFEAGLMPAQRRAIHTMAHHLGLNHFSTGEAEKRQVHITRLSPARMSPPNTSGGMPNSGGDTTRGRALNRAATTEGFNDNRHIDAASYNNTLRGQTSLNLMPVQDIFGSTSNLRAAKSYADLRSYTPSPVYSTTSLSNGPSGLGLQQIGSNGQNVQTPLLTPAASHQTLGSQRDENILVNGFGGMSLGTSIAANAGSPRRLRNMFSWDQENQSTNPATAPIGSNRAIGSNVDGRTQPMRQPAIPTTDRSAGFKRPNGHQTRGSDEYRNTSTPEIIVE